ncbi:hypothetical protein LSUE1_G001471 [Lachnellula suecica]|uniref:Uncharacterized protein n=1 Tax=Lachnellula suecica TaxID=602035 RepID=A0A8T9CLQ6_9HELO|nr:hypothetical protein LSUE1_G001471 [Lachnellula suecica]
MRFKNLAILTSALASLGSAAPVASSVEARDPNIYGAAHTLKMEADEFKKCDPSIYGTAHTLKMANDEFLA